MSDDPANPVVSAVLADPVVQAAVALQAGEGAPPPSTGAVNTGQPGQSGSMGPQKPDVIITPAGKATAAPTTTEEQDRATVGQRRINFIWESQQALIATAVVGTVLYVSANLALLIVRTDATEQQMAIAVTAFVLLSNIINLVIGFYFGRTNHQKVGGVQQGR